MKKNEIFRAFFAGSEKKKHSSVRWRVLCNYFGMTCPVLLQVIALELEIGTI